MPGCVARQADQSPSVAFFWCMVRLRAMGARLHVVTVPLLSGAGLNVLVSQEVIPRRGRSLPDRLALAGRADRVIGIGSRCGYGPGWDPGCVMLAYASLLEWVVRNGAYFLVPFLVDSQSYNWFRFPDWPFALGWVGHTCYR